MPKEPHSPAKAYRNLDFLSSRDARVLRILSEYLEPMYRFRRHKVKDRGGGLRRFPRTHLYQRYGLYKVPAVAGWRSAHASA